jgi:hypothetical protein
VNEKLYPIGSYSLNLLIPVAFEYHEVDIAAKVGAQNILICKVLHPRPSYLLGISSNGTNGFLSVEAESVAHLELS